MTAFFQTQQAGRWSAPLNAVTTVQSPLSRPLYRLWQGRMPALFRLHSQSMDRRSAAARHGQTPSKEARYRDPLGQRHGRRLPQRAGLSEEAIVYITSAEPRKLSSSLAGLAAEGGGCALRVGSVPARCRMLHLFCASTLRPLFCTSTTCARHGFGRAAWRTEIRLDDGEPAEGGRREH
jgi:hypothetical protein